MRLLVVDDDPLTGRGVAETVRRFGFQAVTAQDGIEAWRILQKDVIPIVITDWMMPGEDGIELCRRIRSAGFAYYTYIIFLTARDSEFDAVSGLRLGADDYLTKDISLPHLMARVAALFRRLDALKQPVTEQSRIVRGELEIDTDRMTVSWCNQPVGLTLTEFWLVHAMARYPGHVKNRQQLMDAAQAVLDDNTITSHIKRIRRKFTAIDDTFDSIETVYGMGYRWLSE